MKEICIDVRMAHHSGIGTYIRNMVPGLADFYKLRLICNRELVDKWPFLRKCNLIFTQAPIYSLQEQAIFPFLVPSCDLFWAPHYNLPLVPLKAKKRMVSIHDVYHLVGQMSCLKQLYANLIIKRAAKMADRVVTISHFSKSEIIKYTGISDKKISVVHLGVDPNRFTEESDLSYLNQIKMKYGLPDRYFLYVGNLAPHKNINRLLLAWNLLGKEISDWKLVLVGRRFIKNLFILDDKRVLFLENVPDQELSALYTQAYALVHPSLYEGFGLTPLEAMSSGCPAIVSNAASLPEVCGDSAVYVNPYHIEDIAAGMKKMIQNPRLQAEMKNKGLIRSRGFTWGKTIEAHLALLEAFL